MEWVETTGRTIEEAKERALERLGVSEDEAEVYVVAPSRRGLFGRVRSEARVRARVRPVPVPPKIGERRGRERRRRRGEPEDRGSGEAATHGGDASGQEPEPTRIRDGVASRAGGAGNGEGGHDPGGMGVVEVVEDTAAPNGAGERGDELSEPAPGHQAEVAEEFLRGLVAAFGKQALIQARVVDEANVVVHVDGEGLGILVGPGGATLDAVQELVRTVVQRRTRARRTRLFVDIGRYRERRTAALERFVREVASEVLSSGTARVLEPMRPADRKVVHDTVNTIPGVTTRSEGEEPLRRVVIVPDDASGPAAAEDVGPGVGSTRPS